MLNGVVVDPLTQSFLKIALDPGTVEPYRSSLRGFFHDARNRLNLIKLGIYLARRSGSESQTCLWHELDQHYRSLESLVERVQSLIHPTAIEPDSTELGETLTQRLPTWEAWLSASRRTLILIRSPTPVHGLFDAAALLQAMDALVAWRSEAGQGGEPVRLAWSTEAERIRVEWEESGPGSTAVVETREPRASSMALPLLARVMAVHGGTMNVELRDRFSVRLEWPMEPELTRPLDPARHAALR